MQLSIFLCAIVGGEHVRLCAAGRESVRVVREERRVVTPPLPPAETHRSCAHPPRTLYIELTIFVQHGEEPDFKKMEINILFLAARRRSRRTGRKGGVFSEPLPCIVTNLRGKPSIAVNHLIAISPTRRCFPFLFMFSFSFPAI